MAMKETECKEGVSRLTIYRSLKDEYLTDNGQRTQAVSLERLRYSKLGCTYTRKTGVCPVVYLKTSYSVLIWFSSIVALFIYFLPPCETFHRALINLRPSCMRLCLAEFDSRVDKLRFRSRNATYEFSSGLASRFFLGNPGLKA